MGIVTLSCSQYLYIIFFHSKNHKKYYSFPLYINWFIDCRLFSSRATIYKSYWDFKFAGERMQNSGLFWALTVFLSREGSLSWNECCDMAPRFCELIRRTVLASFDKLHVRVLMIRTYVNPYPTVLIANQRSIGFGVKLQFLTKSKSEFHNFRYNAMVFIILPKNRFSLYKSAVMN